jgi:phospholipase C
VNGLGTLTDGQPESVLLTNNPNSNNPANNPNAINPFRLDRSQASTCDQGHSYGPEQQAYDQGLMDLFPLATGAGESSFCAAPIRLGEGQGVSAWVFRWQYSHSFVELRAVFCNER